MQFGSKPLFENISVKFGGGNRYGLIGANGSGKSTFMKILGGDLEPTLGNVSLDPNERIGKLRQDQFAFEEFTVLDTVIMGHKELWEVKQERDRIYALPEMSEEDGYKVADLEVKYGEMDGYSAEARAGELLLGVGIPVEQHYGPMSEVAPGWKLRVLLAQALFADPDILLLDEPTTGLDPNQIVEIRELIKNIGREKTVIMSSHILAEIEATCDRVLIINKGKIVADGTSAELRNKSDKGKLLKICIQGGEDEDIYNELALIPELENIISSTPHHFEIQCERATEIEKKIFDICCQNNWYISEMTPVETRLEDIFRQVTKN